MELFPHPSPSRMGSRPSILLRISRSMDPPLLLVRELDPRYRQPANQCHSRERVDPNEKPVKVVNGSRPFIQISLSTIGKSFKYRNHCHPWYISKFIALTWRGQNSSIETIGAPAKRVESERAWLPFIEWASCTLVSPIPQPSNPGILRTQQPKSWSLGGSLNPQKALDLVVSIAYSCCNQINRANVMGER